MAAQTELTLGELARIALGTSSLGPANIAVLHSLIDLLLKKLDCRDEKVSVGGYETNILRKLLQQTNIPPYAFQEDKIVILTEKFERMKALEERVEAVSTRLERHFDEIRECNKQGLGDVFQFQNWERYAGPCEDLCIECDPENQLACDLITNADFMKKVLRRISYPLVERMFGFEHLVEELHTDFVNFVKKTQEHYLKMSLVERCIQEIEHLRQQVEEHHLQFLGAMEEVQDMFDAKLDKIHLPALKKYVRDRFDSLERTLSALRQPKSCPQSGGVIMNGIKCLSCGNDRVCTEKTIVVRGVMPDAHAKKIDKIGKKFCNCHYPPNGEAEFKVAHQVLQLKGGRFKGASAMTDNDNNNEMQPISCKAGQYTYKLKQGRDGGLYRMDLNVDVPKKPGSPVDGADAKQQAKN